MASGKGCIHYNYPSKKWLRAVGSRITPLLCTYNCGDKEEYISAQVAIDGADFFKEFGEPCETFQYRSLRPCTRDQAGYDSDCLVYGPECYFTMPDNDVTVHFYTHHWDGNKWIEDVHETEVISPIPAPTGDTILAGPRFILLNTAYEFYAYVFDANNNPIDGVKVGLFVDDILVSDYKETGGTKHRAVFNFTAEGEEWFYFNLRAISEDESYATKTYSMLASKTTYPRIIKVDNSQTGWLYGTVDQYQLYCEFGEIGDRELVATVYSAATGNTYATEYGITKDSPRAWLMLDKSELDNYGYTVLVELKDWNTNEIYATYACIIPPQIEPTAEITGAWFEDSEGKPISNPAPGTSVVPAMTFKNISDFTHSFNAEVDHESIQLSYHKNIMFYDVQNGQSRTAKFDPFTMPDTTRELEFLFTVDYTEAKRTLKYERPEEAKGRVKYCDPPVSAEEGDEIEIPTVIDNIGEETGKFRMSLIDDVTNEEIEHEPKLGWKELRTFQTYEETLDTDFWVGAMPDHDWDLRIEVGQESIPTVADDVKKFKIKLGGPGGRVIELSTIPVLVQGQEYTFMGKFTRDGDPVSGAVIEIWEEDVFFNDKLCEGVTDDEGNFATPWTVTAVEGILGGPYAELFAKHTASGTKSTVHKVLIKKSPKLITTTTRYNFKTLRPVDIELEYSEEGDKWKPVKGYPKEVTDNPSEHTFEFYNVPHRVRATRKYIIRELRSDWEEIGNPMEFAGEEKKVKLDMKGYIVIGEE